jgi:hypothetical protein
LNLANGLEALALKIGDAIKTFKIETEKRVIRARNAVKDHNFNR